MAQLTQDFFQIILTVEGGYQNRADDSGNYNSCGQLVGTNMGVSAVAYSNWTGRCPSAAEMKGITQEVAFNFYAWYFHVFNCYKIENQQLAELCMNNTMGSPSGAAKAEQRALKKLGYTVSVDGSRGTQTLQALNSAAKKNMQELYNSIREEWIKHLNSINKPQFLSVWMRRLDEYFPALENTGNNGQGDGDGKEVMASMVMLPILLFVGYQVFK